MRRIGEKLGSDRLTLFETLADDDDAGLTIPELVRITRLPGSSISRAMKSFLQKEVVVISGHKRKAPIFRVNGGDHEIVEAVRALQAYTLSVSELDAQRAIAVREEAPRAVDEDFAPVSGSSIPITETQYRKAPPDPTVQVQSESLLLA